MKLIVGLGNPGPKYALNRHNIGFLVVDSFLERLTRAMSFKNESPFKSQIAKLKHQGQDLLLAKPQTFMNLSGEAVQAIKNFYRLELADLLVVQDDVDLPFGTFRYHIRRGSGGQNGIKSIHQMLGTDDYTRLKMGVGRPQDPRFSVADYVLSNFSEGDDQVVEFIDRALESMEYWMQFGTEKTANKYNSLSKGP